MNVVIAGGGTAGHVNPALALAAALPSDRISFVGTQRGVESTMVPQAGFDIDWIDIVGFDRSQPARLPSVGLKAAAAVLSARRVLDARIPSVVVGMGGYVSLPVVLAARTLRIPVVLHEQNIVLGLAHRVSKPFARALAVSFEETLSAAGSRAVHVGNPVVPAIANLDREDARKRGVDRFGLDPSRRTLIVFGGSLGARTLNAAAPALAALWKDRSDIQILHIAGRASEAGGSVDDPPVYRRIDYTDAMHEAYAVADLAICRGGATTVAELAAVGLPAIIVPYPHHRDRQQERHADVLERAGAAVKVNDADASAETLAFESERLLTGDRLGRMSIAAKALGRPRAAEELAGVVRKVAA